MLIYYLIALTIGVLVVIAPILNGRNAQRYGTVKASFYNYLFALLTSGLLWAVLANPFKDAASHISLSQLSVVPPLYFVGGIVGCFIILLMNHFAVRIKAFYVVILPFLGQMTMGLIIDALLFDVFDLKRVLGILIILLGLWLQTQGKSSKNQQTQLIKEN